MTSNKRRRVMSSEEIIELVETIRQSPFRRSPIFEREFRKENAGAVEAYPTLIAMAFEAEHFDMDHLRFMLCQKKQVDSNDATQHEASVQVGKRLADTFVMPKLTTPEDSSSL